MSEPTRQTPSPPWALPPAALAALTGTDLGEGLSELEAAARLARYGRNELRAEDAPSWVSVLLAQFRGLVIWVLIGAAVLSAVIGEPGDAVAIGTIVLLNACIGFYQEYHAARAVAALRRMTASQARVVRAGSTRLVPAAEVVPGDLLLLEAGDVVAADARLVEAHALKNVEASLTGESEPVTKQTGALSDAAPLVERACMVYLGSSVAAGTGRAVVVDTGRETEFGRIAELLRQPGDDETPLQRRLDRVGRLLLVASLGIVALVFALGLLRGERPGPMLLTAVSLAIAAVPEGLPAIVTVALSLGVGRMARRNALIRRLPAVETLGSAQVVCTDKTGTLTTGRMTVRTVWTAAGEIDLTGMPPRGDPLLCAVLTTAAASSDAELREGQAAIGDPTEVALLVAAARCGIHRAELEAERPRLEVLPFDAERRRMTVVRQTEDGCRAYVKGAPEAILACCSRILSSNGPSEPLLRGHREAITRANERLAGQALRVIAVAYRDLPEGSAIEPSPERLEADLTFAGLIGMQDPPRPEAQAAVRRAQEAGIRVVMITGDHPQTAGAIARELGILGPQDELLSGPEVEQLCNAELRERVDGVAVYARATAEDKLRIVRAFRDRGRIVAMTGDGVNDAPAVREAHIGVAMGTTGTEVTRDPADMVIVDDNFASIVAAVEEGRGIYDNIRKCLQYLLAGNTAEILVMLVAVVIGWPIPLLPLHLLWINLVTDGLPALALAADPASPGLLRRPPRPADEQMANAPFLQLMLLTGAITAAVGLLAFYIGYGIQHDLTAARNYAFTTIVYAELLRSFGVRSERRGFWSVGPANWRLTAVVVVSIALQNAIHQWPVLQRLFGIAPIHPLTSVALLALGGVPFLLLEIRKGVLRHSVRAA